MSSSDGLNVAATTFVPTGVPTNLVPTTVLPAKAVSVDNDVNKLEGEIPSADMDTLTASTEDTEISSSTPSQPTQPNSAAGSVAVVTPAATAKPETATVKSVSFRNVGVSRNPRNSISLPSHHRRHAAEFWFPECRDCSCCNGFKYGCSCNGTCKCVAGTEGSHPPSMSAVQEAPHPGRGGPVGRGYSGGPYDGRGGRGGVRGGRGGRPVRGGRGYHARGGGGRICLNQKPPPCRFFRSPGGCRFGDNCRFSHY